MQNPMIEKVALDREAGGGAFPFGLARQAMAGPAGEGIGLVMAHVHDRRERIERPETREREFGPALAVALPIKRRLPSAGADRRPAVAQPELGPAIAAVGDEGEIVAVGDEPRRQA